jgi:hypothetical protein
VERKLGEAEGEAGGHGQAFPSRSRRGMILVTPFSLLLVLCIFLRWWTDEISTRSARWRWRASHRVSRTWGGCTLAPFARWGTVQRMTSPRASSKGWPRAPWPSRWMLPTAWSHPWVLHSTR